MISLLAVTAGCGGDGAAHQARTTTTSSVPTGDLGVGTRTLTFVDDTRDTHAHPDRNRPARDERTIEVILQYPTEGGSGEQSEDTAITNARPAAGRFPLVVFSHGLTGTGSALQVRSLGWAEAGYIVALPTFPLSRVTAVSGMTTRTSPPT